MCDGNHKKLCINSDCEKCFNRSFISNDKSLYLVDDVDPRMIMLGS